jgi:hypothetical protein
MKCSKLLKFVGAVVGGMLLTQSLTQADIISTIENAKSGSTVSVSGTYSGLNRTCTVPSGVTVKGPATFSWTTGYNSDGLLCKSGTSGQQFISLTCEGCNHAMWTHGGNSVKFTNCTGTNNKNNAIVIDNGSANCTISGCVAFGNNDSSHSGKNADGMSVKDGAGSGNVVTNSTCYDNSDDGFDYYNASQPINTTNCLSYSNGFGSDGDGNGFKMGGSGDNVAHTFTSCVAHNAGGTSPHGFSTNSNIGKIHLTTCHSYSNGENDVLGNCILTNCTMQT